MCVCKTSPYSIQVNSKVTVTMVALITCNNCVHVFCGVSSQEIDELLGQNLTQEDEDAIAEELESIIQVC